MQLKVVRFVPACACGFAAAIGILLAGSAAAQTTYTWDPGQTGTGSDGGGTWDTQPFWASGGSDLTWSDSNDAVFGYGTGAAGPVSISNVVAPHSITFNPAGSETYVISGGSINLYNASTSIVANAVATISSPLVGSGGLTMSGAGALTLSGQLSFAGPLTASGGTLTLAGAAANTYAGTTTLTNGYLFLAKSPGTNAIGGDLVIATSTNWPSCGVELGASEQIPDTSVIYFQGSGYSGFRLKGYTETVAGLSCSNGSGVIENYGANETSGGNMSDGALILDGTGTYSFNGYMRSYDPTNSAHYKLALKMSGGFQTLAGGQITYSGPTTLNGGTLSLLNTTGFVSPITFNGGALAPNGQDLSGLLAVIPANQAAVIDLNGYNTTFAAPLSGGGGLTTVGGGSLTLAGTGSDTYGGLTTVLDGTLILSKSGGAIAVPGNLTLGGGGVTAPYVETAQPNQLGPSTVVNFTSTSGNWARFAITGNNQTIAGVTDAGGGIIENGVPNASNNATLTFNLSSTNNNVSGYVRDNDDNSTTGKLNIATTGNGMLTFSGANITYTGSTTVSGGTLQLQNTPNFASPVTVNANGTLQLQNTPNFASPVTVNANGTLQLQNTPNFASPVTVNANGSVNLTNTAAGFSSRMAITGTISGSGTVNVNNSGAGLSGGWVILTSSGGLNNFSGAINVNSGALSMDGLNGALSGNPSLNVLSGGVFGLRGQNIAVGALTGNGDVANDWSEGNNTLTVSCGSFSGVIHGDGSAGSTDQMLESGYLALVKTGTGLLTFSGGNTYSGGTTINNGTLAVASGGINVTNAAGCGFTMGSSGVPTDTPTYIQTGGTVNATASVYIGPNAGNGPSTFTVSGGVFNANTTTVAVADSGNAVVNVNGGSVAFGNFWAGIQAGSSATINLSSGSLSCGYASGYGGFSALGYCTGSHGVLNISGGTVAALNDLMVGGWLGYTAAGVVNQSNGVFNMNVSILLGWDDGGGCGYGGYILSGGTLNMTGGASTQFTVSNQGRSYGLFSQTNGVSNFTGNLFLGYANYGQGGAGVLNVSGGVLTHSTGGYVMDTGGYSGPSTGILTVRGSGYFQEQTGNFLVVNGFGSTGIVNLLSGGTLEVNKISAGNGMLTIDFNGGTLRAYSVNAGASFLGGLTNAFIYPAGLILDTNGQNVTISQNLTAPASYGVGAAGATIPVASGSGGSGYIGPPVVTFTAPAGGVPATGVAVIDANGTVTGITITNPGSGYANGESVAVSFNGNSNTSNAAVVAASAFSVPAGTQNSSGGVTVIGNGTVTLSGNNSYGGGTAINGGTLQLGNNSALGSTSGNLNVASGAVLDINGYSPGVGALSGSGTIDNVAGYGSPTLTVGNGDASGAVCRSDPEHHGRPRIDQDRRRDANPLWQQHLFRRDDDQRRHAPDRQRHERRVSRQPERHGEQQRHVCFQPLRHADLHRRDQRQRAVDGAGRRHVDPQRQQHLYRRHDRQCRHAPDRQRRKRRGPRQPEHHVEQQRHAGLQPRRPALLQRHDQRQRAVGEVGNGQPRPRRQRHVQRSDGDLRGNAGTRRRRQQSAGGDGLDHRLQRRVGPRRESADRGQPERLGRGNHHEQPLLQLSLDVDGGPVLRLDDDLRREHHRQRRLGAFRQRPVDPQRHEHVLRRDDRERRHAGHRRPQRAVGHWIGDDRRRRAAGVGQRRGHRRIACGLVAGRFGRGRLECGVGPGDARRI